MQGNYNLGNYSEQLGVSQDEMRNAYSAAGGNPYDVAAQPAQQQPQTQAQANGGGLGTLNQMNTLAGGSAAPGTDDKGEKKSGLDNALGIVGSIISFL